MIRGKEVQVATMEETFQEKTETMETTENIPTTEKTPEKIQIFKEHIFN